MKGMRRAVFLDRDGTINEEAGYLGRIEDLRVIEGAGAGVRLLNQSGYSVVVVTNQSGVARGIFDEAMVEKIHLEISRRLAEEGAFIDRWYYCPHHPTQGVGRFRRECVCRKPFTGMLDMAGRDLGVAVSGSFVVGDSVRDIELALNAGARPVLVLTGYGGETLKRLTEGGRASLAHIAPDILEACKWICGY